MKGRRKSYFLAVMFLNLIEIAQYFVLVGPLEVQGSFRPIVCGGSHSICTCQETGLFNTPVHKGLKRGVKGVS